MKRVYLIPPKEKLGPFELIKVGGREWAGEFYVEMLKDLGFTIETSQPDRVEVTRVMLAKCHEIPNGSVGSVWQKLCEIAAGKE